MYNTVMGNFEKRCTVLQSENRRLRDVLADIQIEMYELSNSAIPGGTSPRKTHSPRANKGTQILWKYNIYISSFDQFPCFFHINWVIMVLNSFAKHC